MMPYMFIFLWAGLQICFAQMFIASFLEVKRRKDEVRWICVVVWLMTAIFGLFEVEGFYGYLMYLLAVVLILLMVHGEFGSKGLCLLFLSVLISVVVDMIVGYFATDMEGEVYYLAVTVGKAFPLLIVLVARRLRLFSMVEKKDGQERDTLLLRQHMEMQQESMAALEANFRMQRKSAHEFEHHIQVLGDLLEHDEVGVARDYLKRLKKNRSFRVMSVSSNHPVIDVILNQKYQTARENEIIMQIQINDLSAVTIPSDFLVVVLTNLLDNAIEACRKIDGYREIICSVLYDEGLYVCIRNTSEPVQITDEKIPTSKQDSLSHGFGLLSVTYVLDKLDAEYTFSYDEGWFYFAAEIDS